MADGLPKNLYTAGAVQFNATPQTNFLIQALAHQQAKRDALDMYIQRVMQDVSGRENQMRDVDINGGWGKKLNDWQNFYQQNKQAILNPRRYGYDALNQFNAMHQDLLGEARQSTELNKQRLTMAQMMNEKLKKGDPIPDSDINELHQFDKSLYDPTRYIEENTVDKTTGLPFTSRRKPGMEYLSPNIPDLNEKQYFQTLTTGKKQLPTPVGAPEKILDDKGQWNWRMRQNYQMGYGDEDLKSMADKVRIDALQNRAVKKKAEEQFEQLSAFPNYQQQLNNTFKKYYNTDAQTPGDFYAASVLNQLGQKQQAQPKEYEDIKAKTQYTQSMISGRQSAKVTSGVPTGNAFDEFKDDDYGNFKVKDGVFYNKDGTPKNGSIFITGDVLPTSVRSALKAGGIDPTSLNRGVDATVQDGKITSISNKRIGTITRDVMQGVYQLKLDTEPKTGKHMEFSKPTTPTIPSYKMADLKKAGWTDEQIKTATKAGKIKVQ